MNTKLKQKIEAIDKLIPWNFVRFVNAVALLAVVALLAAVTPAGTPEDMTEIAAAAIALALWNFILTAVIHSRTDEIEKLIVETQAEMHARFDSTDRTARQIDYENDRHIELIVHEVQWLVKCECERKEKAALAEAEQKKEQKPDDFEPNFLG